MKQYRLAWRNHDGSVDAGPLSNTLKSLLLAEEFGNKYEGAGSHWVEEWDGAAWNRRAPPDEPGPVDPRRRG